MEALRFGVGIRRHGYNLFALGPPGVGKRTLVHRFLAEKAARDEVPSDWCYVENFEDSERPRAIELPAGLGARLQRDMERTVEELRVAMRASFESDEYRARKQQLVEQFQERQEKSLEDIRDRAEEHDVALVQTDGGIGVAPTHEGMALEPERFRALPEEERERLEEGMEEVGRELPRLLQRIQHWGREHQEAVQALDRAIARETAHRTFERLRTRYGEFPELLDYFEQVEADVVENASDFLDTGPDGVQGALREALIHEQPDGPSFQRYQVNVLVDSSELDGAPVVYEDNPTYSNLLGRIEHEARFGALITNFTHIKAGALHRAAGGYLLLDALKLVQNPFVWEALKRALRSGELRIESLGRAVGIMQTVSLEPEPVALGTTKIVLLGERRLYYLLAALDPDFLELFKVLVDFDETMDRQAASQELYAHLVASLVAKHELRPFDRHAVARVVEEAARAAGDAEKLSVGMRRIVDLLREADYWAGDKDRATVAKEDVQTAIDAQRFRSGRVSAKLLEAVRRGDLLVSTTGESTGQVNGLSVVMVGEHASGHPTRITATVRLGKGEVIDIEREVELGGPIHSKGVFILSGFLGARYATRFPLSLSATLVFEQSYSAVEGDSASLAELCSLMSALADLPLRQSLAITGSVNQQGEAQSVGGVNEKIEGFFDVCKERGLTGDQGVIIPRSNVKNLMLRDDVVEAAKEGKFHVHAVASADDAMELLTGKPTGARDESGRFPEGSINERVESRLATFAEHSRQFLGRRSSPAPAPR